MGGRYVSNSEYGAANLVALVLQYREKHGEIDGRLVALAGAIDDKIATLRNDLLGGAGPSYDTFKELQDLFLENKDLLDELKNIAGKHVRFDIVQSLTTAEKALARSNIDAASLADVDDAVNNAMPLAPTATVSKVGDTATITLKDRNGTTTASISDGATGAVYQPSVDSEGNISWTNNGGLANPVTRSIRGPQGPQGDRGEQGIQGETGSQGIQGERGPQGYTFTPQVSSSGVLTWTNNGGLANPSAVSVIGPKGDKGDTGATGATGATGPKGDQGADGAQGPQGVTFTPSLSSSGVLTFTNDGGLPNPAAVSLKGPKGEPGKDGVNGKDGADGKPFTFSDFTQDQLDSLRGPSGSDGKDGLTPAVSFRYDQETGLLYYSVDGFIDGNAEVW